MDKDNKTGDLLAQAASPTPATRGKRPPLNAIVPQQKVAKWDEQIDGIVIDLDTIDEKVNRLGANQVSNAARVDAQMKWSLIRDIIIILILAMIMFVIGYNTMTLWDWH